MKKILLPLLLLLVAYSVRAQLNTTLISNLDFPENVNDVWGYAAPDGTEYAIVGTQTSIVIVSLADPADPVIVGRVDQTASTWRDMKTYGSYAYVTADVGSIGLTVIDLSNLPAGISSETYAYQIPGFESPYVRAHNLYIDTTAGLAFTAGGDQNINRGGVIIFDLKEDPAHPTLRAVGPEVYAHDVYVQDNIMYTSEIYAGELGIYNISDLDNIVKVGQTLTPYKFTHNAWANEDGTVVFTTDEKSNASVAAYDISEYNDIKLLDEYRPLTSLNTNTIPHNVHYLDGYLSISYYTDGLRVVDASDPTNLVEVANYDTFGGVDGGFNGNWGVYPFLPSGLTLISDRQSGLFVVQVDYKRAARISGLVIEADGGAAISGARVEILSAQANRSTVDALGGYATGVANSGTYLVEAYAEGYYTDTVEVTLENGEVVFQDFALSSAPIVDVEIVLASSLTGNPIVGAFVEMTHHDRSFVTITDSSGTARVEDIYDYNYRVTVTAWGYQLYRQDGLRGGDLTGGDTLYLQPGYEDSFATDLGWVVSGNATGGAWQRGRPTATFGYFGAGQPDNDSPADYGDQAYITDLRGGPGLAYDVDGGPTILTSPKMDLSGYGNGLMLTYDYWFTNSSGGNEPNDSLTISLAGPTDTIMLVVYSDALPAWTHDTVFIDGILPLAEDMRLIVSVADPAEKDNLVEAGFDNFRLLDSLMLSPVTAETPLPSVRAEVYPNPSGTEFALAYDLQGLTQGLLDVYSLTGQRVMQRDLTVSAGKLSVGYDWKPGVYLLRVSSGGRPMTVLKLIKL